MEQASDKVAVIFQDKYRSYVETFLTYPNRPIEAFLFSLDEDVPVVEGFQVASVVEISAYLNEKFSYVVSFSDIDNNVEDFVRQAYADQAPPILFYEQVEKLLSPAGKMTLLKCWVEINMPRRPNAYTEVGDFTYYTEPSIMSTIRDGSVMCRIGKFCSIAKGLLVLLGTEHATSWLSSYPFSSFVPGCPESGEPCSSKGDVIIGNDVWIGNGVTVLSGVTIGDGCIIGAKTVVTKSVEPYSVVVGNPGRVIRKRFDEETIGAFLEMRWWDWPYEQIYEIIPCLQSGDFAGLRNYWKNHVK